MRLQRIERAIRAQNWIQKKAWTIWTTKIKPENGTFKKIMSAVQKQKESEDWQKENGKYIPHPTTWLNGERWLDENNGGKNEGRTKYF